MSEQNTVFIGREAQLAAVQKELVSSQVRLLTLTGPGGVGKTRLGQQVTAGLADEFQHVFFVELAPVRTAWLVPPTIAQALGIQEPRGESALDNLIDYVKDQYMLLVLDSFGAEAVPMLVELLAAAPRLKVLATACTPLHAPGEYEYPVPPLSLPDPGQDVSPEHLLACEAGQLFNERARAARADFAITGQNTTEVAELCVRLAGLPLAIELAAARVQSLPPHAILASLKTHLPPASDRQDSAAWQQVMRGALDWSYNLLQPGEKSLFCRLAVFAGGFTPKAAEAVCEAASNVDVLGSLNSLLGSNLLKQLDPKGENGLRYGMLETIRQYALERLADSGQVETSQRQHARFFLAMTRAADLYSAAQIAWLNRLETEQHNLRVALEWALAHEGEDAEVGVEMAGALKEFWLLWGHASERRRWLEKALEKSSSSAHVRAGILEAAAEPRENPAQAETLLEQSLALYRQMDGQAGIAHVLWALGEAASVRSDYERTKALYAQSLALYQKLEDKPGISKALVALANVARLENDYEQATTLYEQSLALSRTVGNKRGIIDALWGLGFIARDQLDYRKAARRYAEMLALTRELEDNRRVARLLNSMGEMARLQGDYAQAAALYNDSLSLSRQVGYRALEPTVLHNMGYVALQRADWGKATAFFSQSLGMSHAREDLTMVGYCLAGLAGVAVAQGQPERAVRLFGLAEALLETIGDHLDAADQAEWNRNVAAARAQLDEATFAAAWQAGRAMRVDDWMEA